MKFFLCIVLLFMSTLNAEIRSIGKSKIRKSSELDQIVKDHMSLIKASSASFSIYVKGKMLYSKAFGDLKFKNQSKPSRAQLYRIASNSKPVLAAVIEHLIRKRKLRLSSKVIPIINRSLDDKIICSDKRFYDITVEDLLKHEGGWDRSHYDPVFNIPNANLDLMKTSPLELVRYMATQKLDFPPGEKSVYSNFGYVLLARVVEAKTKMPYKRYLESKFLPKYKIKGIKVGSNKRQKDEVHYPKNAFTFNLELMDGAGGLIASSEGLCQFLEKFWINGQKRTRENYSYNFFGSLPGTSSITYQTSRISFVIILNNRRENSNDDLENLKKNLVAKIDELCK